jgi:hypothetical protein
MVSRSIPTSGTGLLTSCFRSASLHSASLFADPSTRVWRALHRTDCLYSFEGGGVFSKRVPTLEPGALGRMLAWVRDLVSYIESIMRTGLGAREHRDTDDCRTH